MSASRSFKEIFDAPAHAQALREALGAQTIDTPQGRAVAVSLLRPALVEARARLRARFCQRMQPGAALGDMARVLDAVVAMLYELSVAALEPRKMERGFTLVAVGGYGRCELFPYGDVDVIFMHDAWPREPVQRVTEPILYVLWDLGLQVGHAVRSLEDTLSHAQGDISARTALIDMRFVCGSQELYATLERRFRSDIVETQSVLSFVEAKLAERDERHARLGDSRYVLEPNIKEGKGGLRDLHTLYWLARYVYPIAQISDLVTIGLLNAEEHKAYEAALQFLWKVRIHMHFIAGKAQERLTFDMQRQVAEAMGYQGEPYTRAVERFMKRYFAAARAVGNLTRIFCATLEEEKKRKPRTPFGALLQRPRTLDGFTVDGERLNIPDGEMFVREPWRLIGLFATAHRHGLDIHPHALRSVTQHLRLITRALQKDATANRLFMDILLSADNPETALRRMSDAGVLGRFIPDFGRVSGQMQFDMYHVYTVDEHTIFAIGLLHAIEKGQYKKDFPIASEVVHHIVSRRVLYLALFCHDIAKGRGGDHSMLGEQVARALAARFGFSAQEAETAAWLVRYHLLFSNTAFKRDINDVTTIRDFVEKVQSPERLKLLLVLTVADIRAVGPKVWNGWKGALLRDLYYRAEELMGVRPPVTPEQQLQRLQEVLHEALPLWSGDVILQYLDLGSPAFWQGCEPYQHAAIARLHRELHERDLPIILDTRHDAFRAITEIILCTPDQHGLFSKVAGAMALAGANIVTSKIFTLKDGIAVELFVVQDAEGKAFDRPDRLARLSVLLEHVLLGAMDPQQEFERRRTSYPTRREAFTAPPAVFIENKLSTTHTVIEVNGRDRIGLLYRITQTLAQLGLTISTAHISTYGERAIDVFYVKDMFGMKIVSESKLLQIRDALMETLAEPAPAGRKGVA